MRFSVNIGCVEGGMDNFLDCSNFQRIIGIPLLLMSSFAQNSVKNVINPSHCLNASVYRSKDHGSGCTM